MLDFDKIIDMYYPGASKLRDILYVHSRNVADYAMQILDRHPEIAVDREFVYAASMLHDIGIRLAFRQNRALCTSVRETYGHRIDKRTDYTPKPPAAAYRPYTGDIGRADYMLCRQILFQDPSGLYEAIRPCGALAYEIR